MAPAIKLEDREQDTYNSLKAITRKIRDEYGKETPDYKLISEQFNTVKISAHFLHISLCERGIQVKHHPYMYTNRQCADTDIEFYNHISPVEDLLKFIDDPDSVKIDNDTTMGLQWYINICGVNSSCTEYAFERVENGWKVQWGNYDRDHITIHSETDNDESEGREWFGETFDVSQETIQSVFEYIWLEARDGKDADWIEQRLTEFCNWVSIIQIAKPQFLADAKNKEE